MEAVLSTSGLEGVVTAHTRLSSVDGEKGELILAGYPAEEIAPRAIFEEMAWLLWNDVLPTSKELEDFRQALSGRRELEEITVDVIRRAAASGAPAMDALRMGAATIPSLPDGEAALALLGKFPVMVAAYWRFRSGRPLLSSRPELGHAANFLYLLSGEEPSEQRREALDIYLNTVSDHGMNASTFTARVIVSTQSDLVSAVTGAVGALKGPLHGGAPGPVLDMLRQLYASRDIDGYVREKLARDERIMGFGHRIYKVRDPRAEILGKAAEALYGDEGNFYQFAMRVERRTVELLAELKPGRRLQTNVEFATALLLHGIGIDTDLFSAIFAIGRVAGWLAHGLEQRRNNRLIRPQSVYVGPSDRKWIALEER
ncbi:MAG TPA: citrate synthase/methylcitrate synthase [Thermoanaerobaculia bacterium]|nr:citrate synthase/methylcitrate synthase [Thermoanaerobaculia bacterium]